MYEPLERRCLRAADLTADNVSLSPTDVGPNVRFDGGFSYHNEGTSATSGPAGYRVLFRDFDGVETTVVAGSTPAALSAGDGVFVAIDAAVPASIYGKNGQLVVVVDPDGAIAKSDETNNRAVFDRTTVRVARPIVAGRINGTAGVDFYEVSQGGGIVRVVDVSPRVGGNYELYTAAVADLPSLTFDLGDGDDRVTALSEDVTVPLDVDAGAGDDRIQAGAGDDTLDGGAGVDTIAGNVGDDSIAGGDGKDAIYGGDGDDHLVGNAQGDYLNGGAGDDVLSGNGGNDRLNGGTGADHLIGGIGADILSVTLADDGVDTLSGNGGRDLGIAPAGALLSSIERRS